MKLLKIFNNSDGATPLPILIAVVGILGFILVTYTASFKDRLFGNLFPDPPASYASFQTNLNEAKRVSYELHGIIFPQFSTSIKKKLFGESANTGKKFNRFDIAFSTVVTDGPTVPSTSGYNHSWVLADENIRLAFKNGIEPLVVLGESSKFIGRNPNTCNDLKRCFKDPPAKNRYADYIREYVKAVADRYSGNTDDPQNPGQKLPKVSFYEFWNEPKQDFGGANGKPEEYAELSILVYDAIKQANPEAIVTTGGFSNQTFDANEISWVTTVMNTPINGVKAKDKFDVANFHIYVPITRDPNDPSQANKGTVKSKVKAARQFFDDIGRSDAPLWITEHGWPTIAQKQKRDINYNADNPLFKNIPCPSPNPFTVCPTPAEYAQAAYYKESLPILLGTDGSQTYRAATKVFVILRDHPSSDATCDGDLNNGEDEYCSYGLLRFGKSNDPTSITRKPSFCVISKMQPGQTPPTGYDCPSPTPTPTPTNISTPTLTPTITPTPTPVPDTSPPTVTLTSAYPNIVSGPVGITVDATDDKGVAGVTVYVDGLIIAQLSTPPYDTTWDSTGVDDGGHTIQAEAIDTSGNIGQSQEVVLNVDNIPPAPRVNLKLEYKGVSYQDSANDNVLNIGNKAAVTNTNPVKLIWTTFDNPISCTGKSFIFTYVNGVATLLNNSTWDASNFDVNGGTFLIKTLNVAGNYTFEIDCMNKGGGSKGDLVSFIAQPNQNNFATVAPIISNVSVDTDTEAATEIPIANIINAQQGDGIIINWNKNNLSSYYSICASSGLKPDIYDNALNKPKPAIFTLPDGEATYIKDWYFNIYCANEKAATNYNIHFKVLPN